MPTSRIVRGAFTAAVVLATVATTTLVVRMTVAADVGPDNWRATAPATPATRTPASPAPAGPRRPLLFLAADTWLTWTVIDTRSGVISETGTGTSITASVIKVGIAADVLAGLDKAGRDPTAHEADLLQRMIVDSDNDAASELWRRRGGRQILTRLTAACGLTATTAGSSWGTTRTTATDMARLGRCIADGRVASAGWAAWLLDQMRHIRGTGTFGVATARPTDRGVPVAYKNGWLLQDGRWHVNCLAVAHWWTIGVMARYPAALGLSYGADLCAQLAAVLPDDETGSARAVQARAEPRGKDKPR